MRKIEKLFLALLILSGVFFFKIGDTERFFPAQYGFFIFCAGILWSTLLYQKNKWFGLVGFLCSFSFVRTFMFGYTINLELFKISLMAFGVSIVYYFSRHFKLREEILKFLLIPAFLNIALVIVQAFDHKFISFLPVAGVTGFLGNKSVTGYYLAMISPLFWKYCREWNLLLLLALVLCNSILGITAFIIVGLFFLYFENKKHFKLSLISILLTIILSLIFFRQEMFGQSRFHLCAILTTFDGIKHNPILGWGLGSYEVIVSRIKPGDIVHFGQSFNTIFMTNHPHNELLFGWWNMGILFPIFSIALAIGVIKKFTKENIIPFLILLSGIIISMGCFLNPPLWFLMMMSLGIYENKKEEQNAGKNA